MAARKKRHQCHDELVANIIRQPEVLSSYVDRICGPCSVIERPVVEWQVEKKWMVRGDIRTRTIGWADIAVCGNGNEGPFVFLVEVKSQLEKWTAGDVVRQLKDYAQIVSTRNFDRLNAIAAFYCDRQLSESEALLLKSEGIHVLT